MNLKNFVKSFYLKIISFFYYILSNESIVVSRSGE